MAATMTSRDRVLTALAHQRPDRPPLNYYGTPETDSKLMAHLGLETREELLCHFGADMRYVAAHYTGPPEFSGGTGYATGGTDMWGVQWRVVQNDFCAYNEVASHPLADATTLREIEDYPWPNPDWLTPVHLRAEIEQLNDPEPRAIVLPVGSFFETAWYVRGLERFLMDMVECPAIAECLLMNVTGFCKEVAMRALEAADGRIDIAWSASDVGMQTGMLLAPELWRRQVKPWHDELIAPFKEMGLLTRYHSDGAISEIIEDLIDMGLDLVDPIQPKAAGMDAESLAQRFGGRIAFYGGTDTQELLPRGTPQDVEDAVLRNIALLGQNGGYVVAASNAIQADVPVENVLTLFRTAREYRY